MRSASVSESKLGQPMVNWAKLGSLDAIDTWVEIETPERVRFSYRLAGPMQRGAAYLLDLMVRAAFLLFLALFAIFGKWATGLTPDGFTAGLGIIAAFLVE